MLNPLRSYRRYRYNNRYDAPLLILIIDSCLIVLKYACVAAMLALAWLVTGSLRDRHTAQTITTITTVHSESSVVTATNTAQPIQPKLAAQLALSESVDNLIPDNKRNITPKPKVDILDSSWVLQQNPDHFIVQYGSSPDLELLEQFAQEMNHNEPMTIYTYKRTPSGRPVYGIASTLHTDLDIALAYVEQLPANARQFGPWVRPLKNLQNQIKRIENVRG